MDDLKRKQLKLGILKIFYQHHSTTKGKYKLVTEAEINWNTDISEVYLTLLKKRLLEDQMIEGKHYIRITSRGIKVYEKNIY